MSQTNKKYGSINRIWKQIILFVVVANSLGVLMSLFGVSPFTSQVSAWCDSSTFNRDNYLANECVVENLSEIEKLSQGRTLTASEYVSKIKDCEEGNAGGLDNGTLNQDIYHDNGCANAILTCHRNAIDVADCTPDNLKTIGGSECNYGELSSNGNDDCQRLKEMNGAHVDEIAVLACTGEPDTAEGANAANDCQSAISSKCISDGILNDDGTVKGDSFTDAKACAADESKKMAQSAEVCKARGGVWTDGATDPVAGSNSNVTKGCKDQYSDLINEPACTAAGGKWVRTGGGTHGDDYGCQDPNGEPCDGHGGGQPDADGNCPDGTKASEADCPVDADGNCATITKIDEHCGDARVNLLGCGENNKGAAAFNAILKIIIQVLTVLVGVAAVGGLAYASLTYARAEDNSGTVSEARTLIRNIVIGIVLYGFLIAIVTWLVPGLSLT